MPAELVISADMSQLFVAARSVCMFMLFPQPLFPAGSNPTMEVAVTTPPSPIATVSEDNPYHSVGAWIILVTSFLMGTLFGLWLPRLCQRSREVGGQLYRMGSKVWQALYPWGTEVKVFMVKVACWLNENSQKGRHKLRGGTPRRGTHTNTEPQTYAQRVRPGQKYQRKTRARGRGSCPPALQAECQ